MKLTETVTIPERTVTRETGRLCDFPGCGKRTDDGKIYEVKESEVRVEVRLREGESYPDGGSGTEIEIDICPDCFRDKLIPWLQSQGVRTEVEEWDW